MGTSLEFILLPRAWWYLGLGVFCARFPLLGRPIYMLLVASLLVAINPAVVAWDSFLLLFSLLVACGCGLLLALGSWSCLVSIGIGLTWLTSWLTF